MSEANYATDPKYEIYNKIFSLPDSDQIKGFKLLVYNKRTNDKFIRSLNEMFKTTNFDNVYQWLNIAQIYESFKHQYADYNELCYGSCPIDYYLQLLSKLQQIDEIYSKLADNKPLTQEEQDIQQLSEYQDELQRQQKINLTVITEDQYDEYRNIEKECREEAKAFVEVAQQIQASVEEQEKIIQEQNEAEKENKCRNISQEDKKWLRNLDIPKILWSDVYLLLDNEKNNTNSNEKFSKEIIEQAIKCGKKWDWIVEPQTEEEKVVMIKTLKQQCLDLRDTNQEYKKENNINKIERENEIKNNTIIKNRNDAEDFCRDNGISTKFVDAICDLANSGKNELNILQAYNKTEESIKAMGISNKTKEMELIKWILQDHANSLNNDFDASEFCKQQCIALTAKKQRLSCWHFIRRSRLQDKIDFLYKELNKNNQEDEKQSKNHVNFYSRKNNVNNNNSNLLNAKTYQAYKDAINITGCCGSRIY